MTACAQQEHGHCHCRLLGRAQSPQRRSGAEHSTEGCGQRSCSSSLASCLWAPRVEVVLCWGREDAPQVSSRPLLGSVHAWDRWCRGLLPPPAQQELLSTLLAMARGTRSWQAGHQVHSIPPWMWTASQHPWECLVATAVSPPLRKQRASVQVPKLLPLGCNFIHQKSISQEPRAR